MKRILDTDNADDLVLIHKLEQADQILAAARTEGWRLTQHHEMFVALVHKGFCNGLWTMENGDEPAGQDLDGWRKQVVDAARFIADCAYPQPTVAKEDQ